MRPNQLQQQPLEDSSNTRGEGDAVEIGVGSEAARQRRKQQYASNVKSRSMDSIGEMRSAFLSTASNGSFGCRGGGLKLENMHNNNNISVQK
jgi:hypothetical protein